MSLTSTLNERLGEGLESTSPRILAFFGVPVLIGLNVLILSGFIVYLFLNLQPGPDAAVVAAVQHTSTTQVTKIVETQVPIPTNTPKPRW